MFSNAEFIVSANSGPRMVNAMFCRPGTKVVEIIAEGQQDPWSVHLCAMLELNLRRAVSAAIGTGPHRRSPACEDLEFSFSVDVPRLVETVKTLLGE